MKLSKRLECIAKMIEKQARFEDQLADIGTDHGYLPCHLVKNGIVSFAYACDVAIGPLNSSKETIAFEGLEDKVMPLLGNGLEPVIDKKPTIVSISGMGGFLIVDILKKDLSKLETVHTLVLQPNICEGSVREYLCQNGWHIVDEDIVKDVRHRYEVIVFKRYKGHVHYSPTDYQFGPILRRKQSDMFKEKWQREKRIREEVLSNIEDPKHIKYIENMNELKQIKEILNEN